MFLKQTMFLNSKGFYCIKQASRAWSNRLSNFSFKKRVCKKKGWYNLIWKGHNKNYIIIQIYVDDIIFNVDNESLYKEFSKLMQGEFEKSMMESSRSSLTSKTSKEKRTLLFINKVHQINVEEIQHVKPQAMMTLIHTFVQVEKDENEIHGTRWSWCF